MRILETGGTFAARNAGTRHAASAVTSRNTVTEAKVKSIQGSDPVEKARDAFAQNDRQREAECGAHGRES